MSASPAVGALARPNSRDQLPSPVPREGQGSPPSPDEWLAFQRRPGLRCDGHRCVARSVREQAQGSGRGRLTARPPVDHASVAAVCPGTSGRFVRALVCRAPRLPSSCATDWRPFVPGWPYSDAIRPGRARRARLALPHVAGTSRTSIYATTPSANVETPDSEPLPTSYAVAAPERQGQKIDDVCTAELSGTSMLPFVGPLSGPPFWCQTPHPPPQNLQKHDGTAERQSGAHNAIAAVFLEQPGD